MPGMAKTWNKLRSLTDDEIINGYDIQASTTIIGSQYYLDELNRRYQERHAKAMLRFTKWIANMTVVITLATVTNIGLAAMVVLQC